jgi:hypothetical protein
MGDKLAAIFEYRLLRAKQRDLQIPLTANEEARVKQLRHELPDRVPSVDERDSCTLLAAALPAQFVAAGRFGSGTLCNVSASGLAITTLEEPPGLGQRLIVHVQDTEQFIEYTFPCRVVARIVKGAASMGLRFEGVPSKARIGVRSGAVWRSDVFFADDRPSTKPPPDAAR